MALMIFAILLTAGKIYAFADPVFKLANWFENEFQRESDEAVSVATFDLSNGLEQLASYFLNVKEEAELTILATSEEKIEVGRAGIGKAESLIQHQLALSVTELSEEELKVDKKKIIIELDEDISRLLNELFSK